MSILVQVAIRTCLISFYACDFKLIFLSDKAILTRILFVFKEKLTKYDKEAAKIVGEKRY